MEKVSASLSFHTTITFLSPLGIPPFSHFYLHSQPRRLQMWRSVTQCDRWVRLRLLLPVCPRFCHTFFFRHPERKMMSSHAARLHPKAPPSKRHFGQFHDKESSSWYNKAFCNLFDHHHNTDALSLHKPVIIYSNMTRWQTRVHWLAL